jgi:hypothetical protein
MKLSNSAVSLSALVLAIGASVTPSDAQAVEQTRSTFTNPTGICQAALPNFEGVIRKRPLAVQNEGTTDSFITCSYTAQGGPGMTRVIAEFTNTNDGVRFMSCTGVSGYTGFAQTEYLVKSVLMEPGAMNSLVWDAADFEGAPTSFPSVTFSISCNLLPGIGINRSRVDFIEDVGN